MSSSSSSSNTNTTQWIHDVFLNFRGEDVRKTFVSHLYAALTNAGINTFIDDNIPKGTKLGAELVRAIQGSRISIVVFSPNYTSSRWCLDELVKIMECYRTYGQVVVPVFYDIEPSDVRHQRATFGEKLASLAKKCLLQGTQGRLKTWKSALYEAGNLAGWDARAFSEGDLVERIVDSIFGRLDNDLLPVPEFPVGLESRVQQVIQIIEDQSSKCFVVGIWGMGGLGKTTMAKVIYNQIRQRFTRRSFIENIREVCEKDSRGCIELQEQLLTDLLVKTKNKVRSISMGITMIKKRLGKKKALIVLDDVTDFEQFRALCGNCEQMALGSVIIITTRDLRLLNVLNKVNHKVHIFRIKEMDENESLELFSWHAFRQFAPREDFIKLAADIVTYCGGLPLALEVLGSNLFERTKEEWESVLSKLKKIPNGEVQEKLKISYDCLDSMEKNIFLDICFFFIGKDRADVTEILKGCGFHPEIGITVLIERSLIKLDKNNKLKMHDLLRDMGREIVRQSSAEEPEKRNRLWDQQEVVDVLKNQTGTNAIVGLSLKLQRTSRLQFNTEAFAKMTKLRLLQLDHVQLDGDHKYLNKNLRWI